MQVICYELLGFCFYFPEQLFNFRRLDAPKRDNSGNRTQQARPSNTGNTSDQATRTENQ